MLQHTVLFGYIITRVVAGVITRVTTYRSFWVYHNVFIRAYLGFSVTTYHSFWVYHNPTGTDSLVDEVTTYRSFWVYHDRAKRAKVYLWLQHTVLFGYIMTFKITNNFKGMLQHTVLFGYIITVLNELEL